MLLARRVTSCGLAHTHTQLRTMALYAMRTDYTLGELDDDAKGIKNPITLFSK